MRLTRSDALSGQGPVTCFTHCAPATMNKRQPQFGQLTGVLGAAAGRALGHRSAAGLWRRKRSAPPPDAVDGGCYRARVRVVEHPELVRAEVAAGAEVGMHTFTHADLGRLPAWRRALEINLTEHALADAAGITSRLL